MRLLPPPDGMRLLDSGVAPCAELYISNVAVLGPEPPSDGEQKAGGAGWHIE